MTSLVRTGYTKSSKHRVLTREEEVTLGRTVVAGNDAAKQLKYAFIEGISMPPLERVRLQRLVKNGKDAREMFITHNLRLAMSTAAKYAASNRHRVPYEDLIQESIIGLMKAVDMFDPDKGTKFSTYATWWCRQTCQRAIANSGRMIRLPMHIESEVRRLAAVLEHLESCGNLPPKSEIADLLGWDIEKLDDIWNIMESRRVDYLDAPISEDSATSHVDTVVDPLAADVSDEGISNQYRGDILAVVENVLPELEFKILMLRYGLNDGNPRTLQEVGSHVGLTRERVRQYESKAIARLRHPSSGVAWMFDESFTG